MRLSKPSKYRAKPEYVNGHRFASGAEANRYRELLLLVRAGEIQSLELQPVFPLVIDGKPVKIRSEKRPNGTKTKYSADFRYVDNRTGRTVIEDVKGFDTTASRLRRAVVECIYGVEIVLIR